MLIAVCNGSVQFLRLYSVLFLYRRLGYAGLKESDEFSPDAIHCAIVSFPYGHRIYEMPDLYKASSGITAGPSSPSIKAGPLRITGSGFIKISASGKREHSFDKQDRF